MLERMMALADSASGLEPAAIKLALEAVRKHLGMEVAYVSEFVEGRSVFREVDAPGLESLIKPGDSYDLDDVYCRHILAGRLPELMPDTADFPLALTLPITAAVPIGAHMSVPIRLADGQDYGMFCCLSPHRNTSLNDRDLQVMRVFADMAAHQIAQERDREREIAALRARIGEVIEAGAFTFAYQPVMTFAPFRVVGFEALCRFTAEPYRSPDKWFGEAARADMGAALELAVLGPALDALHELPEDIFVSFNASPETILGEELRARLRGYPLHRLVLELTEHAKVEDYGALRAALAGLRAAGVRLAIDDAGAGFASLQHILHLKPDIIKLDIGLTRGVDSDPARRALVSALAFFAQETGAQIVAEGVETEGEHAALRALGIAKGQGYLFGRPADLASARRLIAPPQG